MLTVEVLIVHHQRLFADVLSQALKRAGFARVTIATSLPEVEQVIERFQPDVAVVDGSDSSPLAFAGPLPTLFGRARTRILLIGEGTDAAGLRVGPGCDGVTCAGDGIGGLVHDIVEVARGHVVDRRDDTMLGDVPVPARRPSTGRIRLTPRERDVLACLVDGADNRRIARSLAIRPNTVRTHVQNILMKLGVRSRLEAVSYAVRHGLVATEERGYSRRQMAS